MPKRYENVLLDQYRVMDGIARRYLLSLEESQNPLLSSAHDELYVAMVFEYVKLFQETYNSLDNAQQEIIRCVFIEPEHLAALKASYPLSTFYKLRNRTINLFVRRFYHL